VGANYFARRVKNSVLLFCLFSAASCVYARDADLQKCSDADTPAEERTCLETLSHRTNAKLAKLEKEALERVDAWEQEDSYRAATRKSLVDSSQLFKQYRRSQCGLFQSLAAGGNGASDMKLACSIEVTKDRVRQMKDIADALKPR